MVADSSGTILTQEGSLNDLIRAPMRRGRDREAERVLSHVDREFDILGCSTGTSAAA